MSNKSDRDSMVGGGGKACSCVFDERRLEQENKGLLRKAKGRGVTVDQVVGVQSAETERELEELRRRNSELETQILTIR